MKMCDEAKALCRAVKDDNWKWALYELLKDEVQGAEKYLWLHDLALAENKPEMAEIFKQLASQEAMHSEKINDLFSKKSYTRGTTQEQKQWEDEYQMLLKRHAENKNRLGDTQMNTYKHDTTEYKRATYSHKEHDHDVDKEISRVIDMGHIEGMEKLSAVLSEHFASLAVMNPTMYQNVLADLKSIRY